jgi:hypothetical protein
MAPSRAPRWLGYLGPAIVIVGAAVAAIAIWYMQHARPRAGAVVDTFAIDPQHTIVVRAEEGGDRSFLELREGDTVKWQALIPHYAGRPGRPGVAWSDLAVTVRVERDSRAEVFSFLRSNASKLGGLRLAPEHEPITTQAQGPITLTDYARSYEIVGGRDWNQIIAIDLHTGKGAWKVDLGADPITAGGIDEHGIWLQQGEKRRVLDPATGAEHRDIRPLN